MHEDFFTLGGIFALTGFVVEEFYCTRIYFSRFVIFSFAGVPSFVAPNQYQKERVIQNVPHKLQFFDDLRMKVDTLCQLLIKKEVQSVSFRMIFIHFFPPDLCMCLKVQ